MLLVGDTRKAGFCDTIGGGQGGWVPLAQVLVLISQIIYRRTQKDSKQTLYWKDVGVFEKRTSILESSAGGLDSENLIQGRLGCCFL